MNRKLEWILIVFILYAIFELMGITWQSLTLRRSDILDSQQELDQIPYISMPKDTGTMEPEDQDVKFQMVSNGTDMLVYSAYFEERWRLIRVLGITSSIPPRLYCLLRYSNETMKYVEAHVQKIREKYERRYTAMFILCFLNHEEVPQVLTISTEINFNDASNKLQVMNIPMNSKERNFTVCLAPVHSIFNDSRRLLEWLEVNIILGVEKIFVYVRSCSSEIMTILEMYQSKEYVVILKWPVPENLCEPINKADILYLHYCGQLAALNDCLYRNKGYSNYIAVLDIDEYIIPQMEADRTWFDMLQRLPKSNSYIFRNVFFFGDDSDANSLITQSRFKRQSDPNPPHQRSKYIAFTDNVEVMGIHFALEIAGKDHAVNPRVALLHHYRQEPVLMYSRNYVNSDIMKKYASDL